MDSVRTGAGIDFTAGIAGSYGIGNHYYLAKVVTAANTDKGRSQQMLD